MNSKTTVDQSTVTFWKDITTSRATATKTEKVFLVLMHRGGRDVMQQWAWTRTEYEVHYMPRFKEWRAVQRKQIKRGHELMYQDHKIAGFDTREDACNFIEATFVLLSPAERNKFIGATNVLNN